MLHFLNGVRVINMLVDESAAAVPPPTATPGATASSTATPSPSGRSVNIHTGGGGGDAFLAVPICAIVFTFIYLIIKAIMAPFTQRAKDRRAMPQGNGGGGLTQEEIAVLQKLQRTLTQMESRVESLETILIEQARTEKNYGSKL